MFNILNELLHISLINKPIGHDNIQANEYSLLLLINYANIHSGTVLNSINCQRDICTVLGAGALKIKKLAILFCHIVYRMEELLVT